MTCLGISLLWSRKALYGDKELEDILTRNIWKAVAMNNEKLESDLHLKI